MASTDLTSAHAELAAITNPVTGASQLHGACCNDSERPTLSSLAPELAFVLAPRQNLFFEELVAALRTEAALGAHTSLHVGNFPPPRPDLVYVLVPPHEYFTLLQGRHGPFPEVFRRTIFVCGEQPNTPFFDHNLHLAPMAGAVFDINRSTLRAFASHGVVAEHLQLGWTQEWDHLREGERDIDILFMGSLSPRRERALAGYAETLSRYRTELILSDNSRPNWAQSESFRVDDAKWDLLGRAKVLINVHQGDEPYFEWLRIVQAISNGAVVVSEQFRRLRPAGRGHHLLMGDLDSLHLLAVTLLRDDDRGGACRHAVLREAAAGSMLASRLPWRPTPCVADELAEQRARP